MDQLGGNQNFNEAEYTQVPDNTNQLANLPESSRQIATRSHPMQNSPWVPSQFPRSYTETYFPNVSASVQNLILGRPYSTESYARIQEIVASNQNGPAPYPPPFVGPYSSPHQPLLYNTPTFLLSDLLSTPFQSMRPISPAYSLPSYSPYSSSPSQHPPYPPLSSNHPPYPPSSSIYPYPPVVRPPNLLTMPSSHISIVDTPAPSESSTARGPNYQAIEYKNSNEIMTNTVDSGNSGSSMTNDSPINPTEPSLKETEKAESTPTEPLQQVIEKSDDTISEDPCPQKDPLQNTDVDVLNFSILDDILADEEWTSGASNRVLEALFSPNNALDTDAGKELSEENSIVPPAPSLPPAHPESESQDNQTQSLSSFPELPRASANPPADTIQMVTPRTPPNSQQQVLAAPSSASANRNTLARDILRALRPASIKRKRSENGGSYPSLTQPSLKKTKTGDAGYVPSFSGIAPHGSSTSVSAVGSYENSLPLASVSSVTPYGYSIPFASTSGVVPYGRSISFASTPGVVPYEHSIPSASAFNSYDVQNHRTDVSKPTSTTTESARIVALNDVSDKSEEQSRSTLNNSSQNHSHTSHSGLSSNTDNIITGPPDLRRPSPTKLSSTNLSPNRGEAGEQIKERRESVKFTAVVPKVDVRTSQRQETAGWETLLPPEVLEHRSPSILEIQPEKSPMATRARDPSSPDIHGVTEVRDRIPLFLPSRSPSPIENLTSFDDLLPSAKSLPSISDGHIRSTPLTDDKRLVPSWDIRPYVLIPQVPKLIITPKKTTPYQQGRGKRIVESESREVEESRSRLTRRRCLWRDCSAILDSAEKLLKHTKVVHGSPADGEFYRCKWTDCSRLGAYFESEDLIRHLKGHVYQLVTCPYKGCAYETNTNQENRLLRHIASDHDKQRDIKKPTALPYPSISQPVAEFIEICPAYYSVSIPVVAASISKERHQKLEPLVRTRIIGSLKARIQNLRTKDPMKDSSSLTTIDTEYDFHQEESASRAFVSLRQMSPVINEIDVLEGSLLDTVIISIDGNPMPEDLAADVKVGASPRDLYEGLGTDLGPNLLRTAREEHESLEVDQLL